MGATYLVTARDNLPDVVFHSTHGYAHRSAAEKLQRGDRLICYAKAGRSRWKVCAVLRVEGAAYEDQAPIYRTDRLYPHRVPVATEVFFEEGREPALPLDLMERAALKRWPGSHPVSWGTFVHCAEPLPDAEAGALLELLEAAPGLRDRDRILEYAQKAVGRGGNGPQPPPDHKGERPSSSGAGADGLHPDGDEPKFDVREHTRVQWLLAQLGLRQELGVWIARNDHATVGPDGKPLGTHSLPEFPQLPLPDPAVGAARLVDVLWVDGNRIPAAFEVEHTTDVRSGLGRLLDLAFALGPSTIRLCIVTPASRMQKVLDEVRRPMFRKAFSPEDEQRCYHLSFEKLEEIAQPVLALPNGIGIRRLKIDDYALDLVRHAGSA